jgi:hypothetical protein
VRAPNISASLPSKEYGTRLQIQEPLDSELEAGQVALYSVPDFPEIHPEILMDEYVAHRNNLRPWHLGMRIVKISAELCRGLADDLEVMNNPDLDQFVPVEGIPASGRVTLDAGDRI